MVVDLLVKSKKGPKFINVPDISNFSMSDTNNTLYLYTMNHKVHSIYNKDNIYAVLNHDNFVLYPDAFDTDKPTPYEILIPEFDDRDIFLISATKYDHNTYTGQVTFQIFDNNRPIDVAIVNMKNITGIRKLATLKPIVY